MPGKKIIVFSDSHNDVASLQMAVDSEKNADIFIHLGDHQRDMDDVSLPLGAKMVSVAGNCDFSSQGEYEKTLEICKKRIFLCHGHTYHVKSYLDYLKRRAEELRADVALFGHTHAEHFENCRGLLCLNPGAINRYRCLDRPGYLALFISENGDISAEERYLDI